MFNKYNSYSSTDSNNYGRRGYGSDDNRNQRANVYRPTTPNPTSSENNGVKLSTVLPDKRWRVNEEDAHTELSFYIQRAGEYLQTNDVDCLNIIVRKYKCKKFNFSDGIVDVEMRRLEKLLQQKEVPDQKSINQFIGRIADDRKLLEIKYIFLTLGKGEEGLQSLQKYLSEKSPEDLNHTIMSLADYFKKNPNDKNMEKCNKVLSMYGREIVKIPNIQTPPAVRQVLRASFNGAFTFPDSTSTGKGNGYSNIYNEFADPFNSDQYVGKKYTNLPKDYDWDSNPTFQAIKLSSNMSKLLPNITATIRKQHIPLEVVENCTIADLGHIMYKAAKRRNPQAGESMSFGDINESCDMGTRQKFWLEFGKNKQKMASLKQLLEDKNNDPQYIKDLLKSIKETGFVTLPNAKDPTVYKQPTCDLEAHHGGIYIQDASLLNNVVDVDDIKQIKAIVGYNQETAKQAGYGYFDIHEKLEHGADVVQGDFAYRLICTDDKEKGRVYMSGGITQDCHSNKTEDTQHKTYADFRVTETRSM